MSGHTNDVQRVINTGWDERILVCRNGTLVDTFIIVTTRYVVLLDTMINPQTAESLFSYAQPYLGNGRFRGGNGRSLLVINSHADYDHAWGNQLFAGPGAAHPAPIIASRRSSERLRGPDAVTFLQQVQADEPEIFAPVILTPPTLLFDERLLIDGGDLTLELFATPGHTFDHISLYIPEIRTLLAGDAAELPFPFARAAADLPTMRQSLANLAARQADTVLYCHAPTTIGRQLLVGNIAYFDALEEACQGALARGVPADPPKEADLIALVGCSFDDAMPAYLDTQGVDDFYRQKGHQMQLRMMLTALSDQNQQKK